MKPIIITLSFCFLFSVIKAQETIKLSDEKTITCTGTFISEVQNYSSNGKPTNKGRSFVDVKTDSVVFFTAYVDEVYGNVVYRYTAAKKDLNKEEDAIEIEEVKENGASFQLLKIKTVGTNDLIFVEKNKNEEVEKEEATNVMLIYFAVDKKAEATKWIEKLRLLLK